MSICAGEARHLNALASPARAIILRNWITDGSPLIRTMDLETILLTFSMQPATLLCSCVGRLEKRRSKVPHLIVRTAYEWKVKRSLADLGRAAPRTCSLQNSPPSAADVRPKAASSAAQRCHLPSATSSRDAKNQR